MERPYKIDHLDHLVLRVRDLERAVDFYRRLGGVECIRREGNVSLEMGGTTRVTLQFDPDFSPPSLSSMDHVNFAVDAENIEVVVDYLRSQGLPVEEEERSHSSPSCRVTDPEQNVVEIRLTGFDAAELQRGALRGRQGTSA